LSGQLHVPVVLSPFERAPDTDGIQGCEGCGLGLATVGKRMFVDADMAKKNAVIMI